jgi:8-oxo-dGTP pyrophosphatase MutT (NUDIX family)
MLALGDNTSLIIVPGSKREWQSRPSLVVSLAVTTYVDGPSLLLQKRFVEQAYSGCWELPQGHVEDAESLLAAATRELKEETNLRLIPSSLISSLDVSAGVHIEMLSPLCVVLIHGDLNFLGICLMCQAEGHLDTDLNEPNAEQTWMTRDQVCHLISSGNLFPLNRPMLKAWLAEIR